MRLLKWGIVGAIVIVILIYTIPFVLDLTSKALTQPNIVLAETSIRRTECLHVYDYDQEYRFSFTLVNTGDADGIAEVVFLLDDQVEMTDTFAVAKDYPVTESRTIIVADCLDHLVDVRLGNVTKV